jgi:hypothetical protein
VERLREGIVRSSTTPRFPSHRIASHRYTPTTADVTQRVWRVSDPDPNPDFTKGREKQEANEDFCVCVVGSRILESWRLRVKSAQRPSSHGPPDLLVSCSYSLNIPPSYSNARALLATSPVYTERNERLIAQIDRPPRARHVPIGCFSRTFIPRRSHRAPPQRARCRWRTR